MAPEGGKKPSKDQFLTFILVNITLAKKMKTNKINLIFITNEQSSIYFSTKMLPKAKRSYYTWEIIFFEIRCFSVFILVSFSFYHDIIWLLRICKIILHLILRKKDLIILFVCPEMFLNYRLYRTNAVFNIDSAFFFLVTIVLARKNNECKISWISVHSKKVYTYWYFQYSVIQSGKPRTFRLNIFHRD